MLVHVLVAAGVIALWMGGVQAGWAASDAERYHVPQIAALLGGDWRRALTDPLVAMPVAFHVVACALAAATGASAATAGRALSLLGFLGLLALSYAVSSRCEGRTRWLALAGIGTSWTLLSASLSAVTDVLAAALFVATMLLMARRSWSAAALTAVLLVWTRQAYAVVPIAILIVSPFVVPSVDRRAAMLVGLAGTCALAIVVTLWGGFVPPRFRGYYTRAEAVNLGALALSLAWCGVVGVIALAFHWSPTVARGLPARVVSGVAVGGLLVVLPTTADGVGGRWGSVLWRTPWAVIHGHNVLMVALGVLGAAFVVDVAARALRERQLVPLAGIVAAAGAVAQFCLQPFAWQRYIDPLLTFALLFAATSASMPGSRRSTSPLHAAGGGCASAEASDMRT